MTIAELKKNIGNKKLVLGMDRAVKLMKKGEVKEVFFAANCSNEIVDDINSLAKKFNAKVSQLKITNEEVGVAVKKPFAVSVACLLK